MIQSIRKARPRRSPNRVRLVELDGTPAADAATWPAWTDAERWEPTPPPITPIGIDSRGADFWAEDVEAAPPLPTLECEPQAFPTQADLDWLAETEAFEAAERARIEATYPVTDWPDDREYDRWLDRVDASLPSRDELAQLAAHGCV